ncbi:MAG TPA: hypothetical protein VIJ11_10775, partial [Galbitalea sp.]
MRESTELPRRQTETHRALDLSLTFRTLDGTGVKRALFIPAGRRSNRPRTTTPGYEREPEVQGDAIGETNPT